VIEKLSKTPLARVAARRLLDETPHVLDRELSVGTGKVFALADGRVERIKQGYSPMLEILPQGEGFAAAVPELLREAPARLGIDASALDFTVESLSLLDAAVRRLGRMKAVSPEVFPWLLAYVGEVIRRTATVGGRWEMRLEEDGRTWIPWIIDARGNLFPVLGFYKDLLEHGPRVLSLRTFVETVTPIPAEMMQSDLPGTVSGGGVRSLVAMLGRWLKRS
jgi:hypothetical protein